MVPFKLEAHRPGPFSIEAGMYVRDRNGLRSIDLRATGTATAAVAAGP